MDDAYEELKAALEFGATLELTIEQRKSLTDLCVKIAGKLIPAYRLAESQELKKAAVARAEAAERRVIELEGALIHSPLDRVEMYLNRFVAYPSDHARTAHVLWIAHAGPLMPEA